MIHPTAIIDSSAQIDENVTIGPYAIVNEDVCIGANTTIGPYTTIENHVTIGPDCQISQYASIGGDPQDLKFHGEKTYLKIGKGSIIREFCTINRGTGFGGGVTEVGENNYLMAYTHIAHDCKTGKGVILANNSTLAGHIEIGDYATIGGLVAIHQFVKVGDFAYIGGKSAVTKDIPPYVIAAGDRATLHGLNNVGLKRHNFQKSTLRQLKKAYRIFFRIGLTVAQAQERAKAEVEQLPEVINFTRFIKESNRGGHQIGMDNGLDTTEAKDLDSPAIGLIAGGGQFPFLFAQKAAAKGYRVIGAGFRSETDHTLADQVEVFKWLYLGQINKLVKFFKSHGVSKAVMLGSIEKANIFKDIRPDLKALAFIAKTAKTHDDNILTSFADLMAKEGIEMLPSTCLLPELLSPKGCWTRRQPDRAQTRDIHQGWRLAKAVGRLDIGQCLVISNGTVLAVEAIDGTDATIARGGKLARGNGAVVVKLSKPSQDLRFDLPSSGAATIETMHQAGADVLVLEAGKSLSFDREEMIHLADRYKIAIIALTDDEIP